MNSTIFIRQVISFLVFIVILSSCEFQPNGTYFKEIQPVAPEKIEIKIDNYEDTVIIYQKSINLHLDCSAMEQRIYEATAYMDGKEVNVSHSNSNHVTAYLQTSLYSTGYYFLNLHFVVYSGTGSLIDKLESEFYEVDYKIPVYIDKDPPSSVKITSSTVENGYLKLSWDKYKRLNFSHFAVERRFKSGTDSTAVLYFIYDQDQTSFIDSFFLGADSKYRIRVYDKYSKSTYGPLYEVKGLYDPEITFNISANIAQIEWNPTPFSNSYKLTKISELIGVTNDHYNLRNTHEFYDINKNYYSTDHEIQFAQHGNYIIEYIAKNNNQHSYKWERHDVTVYHGEKINNDVFDAEYNPLTNSYFFMGSEKTDERRNYYLKEVDLHGDMKKNKLLISEGGIYSFFCQSKNGELMYYVNSNTNILYKINPTNLAIQNQYNLSEILNINDLSIWQSFNNLSVSNNGIIKIYDNNVKTTYFIDITNEQPILNLSGNYMISDDGKYIGGEEAIYELNTDGSVTLKFNTVGSLKDFVINTELNYVMIQQDNHLCFYDLTSGDLIKRDISTSYRGYDRYGGLVLVFSRTYGNGIIDTKKSFDKSIDVSRLGGTEYNVNNNMIMTQSYAFNKLTTAIEIQ